MLARLRLAVLSALVLAFAVPAAASTHGFDSDGFEYAVVDPGPDRGSSFSVTSTSWRDLERLKDGESEPFYWFVLDGRSWIVRDAATVAEARRIVQPMRELGRKQGKLGAQQGKLGAAQGKLGAQQADLGRQQASASKRAGAGLRRLAERAVGDGTARRTD